MDNTEIREEFISLRNHLAKTLELQGQTLELVVKLANLCGDLEIKLSAVEKEVLQSKASNHSSTN